MADTSGPSRSRLLASLSSRRPISTSSQGHARPIGIAGRAHLVALGFECRGDDAPHVDVVLGQQHDGAYPAPQRCVLAAPAARASRRHSGRSSFWKRALTKPARNASPEPTVLITVSRGTMLALKTRWRRPTWKRATHPYLS